MPSTIWPVTWPYGFDKTPYGAQDIELAEQFAAAVMRFLTLERVGGSPITITAGYMWCSSRIRGNFSRYDFVLDSDHYLCLCGFNCTCRRESYIELPSPVGRVDQVKANGVVVPADSYHIVNGNQLVFDVGELPACGVEVTYLNGYPVGALGSYAAGALAVEYLLGITGSKKCRLPNGVTSISRQGISMDVATGLFPEGVTGITEVDTYVATWNPNGLRVRPKVYSPDINTQSQVTWRKP